MVWNKSKVFEVGTSSKTGFHKRAVSIENSEQKTFFPYLDINKNFRVKILTEIILIHSSIKNHINRRRKWLTRFAIYFMKNHIQKIF